MLLAVSNMAYSSNSLRKDLAHLLPIGWVALLHEDGNQAFDQWLELTAPSGQCSRFEIEFKSRFEPRDIHQIEVLRTRLSPNSQLLLIAPHISTRSRELLRRSNISYADASGNLWLSTDTLFVDRLVAEERSEPEGRAPARTSLRGPATARIVRYICDNRSPLKVRQIAMATNTHPGNVSRVLDFLAREHLIERDGMGAIHKVHWEDLIRRWSQDLKKMQHSQSLLDPRGIESVIARLSHGPQFSYAVTGPY